jgi:hypothetical protein
LIPLPRTYFEIEDIRPGEDELSLITDEIFESTASGISIPKALNRKKCAVFVGERFAQIFNGLKKGQG